METTTFGGCVLCPRKCQADRVAHAGVCGVMHTPKIAKVGLHSWEEPCISYGNGSGTVFFSGCPLKCVFCQNREISHGKKGISVDIPTLAEEILRLQDAGAVNINLVTPTHYADVICRVFDIVKSRLHIPVIYNCGGYERQETIESLRGYVDVFLPDIKFFSPEVSSKYAGAADYFENASKALETMIGQVGYASFDTDGHLTHGVLTRHLVLPTLYKDSIKILDYLAAHYDVSKFAISLMSQYFPTEACTDFPEINRRVTSLEYNRVTEHALHLNFSVGFFQERTSASAKYVPAFDYTQQ